VDDFENDKNGEETDQTVIVKEEEKGVEIDPD